MNADEKTDKDETRGQRKHNSFQLRTVSRPAALKAIHRALHECLIIQIYSKITQDFGAATLRIPSARVRKSKDETRNDRRFARANGRRAC